MDSVDQQTISGDISDPGTPRPEKAAEIPKPRSSGEIIHNDIFLSDRYKTERAAQQSVKDGVPKLPADINEIEFVRNIGVISRGVLEIKDIENGTVNAGIGDLAKKRKKVLINRMIDAALALPELNTEFFKLVQRSEYIHQTEFESLARIAVPKDSLTDFEKQAILIHEAQERKSGVRTLNANVAFIEGLIRGTAKEKELEAKANANTEILKQKGVDASTQQVLMVENELIRQYRNNATVHPIIASTLSSNSIESAKEILAIYRAQREWRLSDHSNRFGEGLEHHLGLTSGHKSHGKDVYASKAIPTGDLWLFAEDDKGQIIEKFFRFPSQARFSNPGILPSVIFGQEDNIATEYGNRWETARSEFNNATAKHNAIKRSKAAIPKHLKRAKLQEYTELPILLSGMTTALINLIKDDPWVGYLNWKDSFVRVALVTTTTLAGGALALASNGLITAPFAIPAFITSNLPVAAAAGTAALGAISSAMLADTFIIKKVPFLERQHKFVRGLAILPLAGAGALIGHAAAAVAPTAIGLLSAGSAAWAANGIIKNSDVLSRTASNIRRHTNNVLSKINPGNYEFVNSIATRISHSRPGRFVNGVADSINNSRPGQLVIGAQRFVKAVYRLTTRTISHSPSIQATNRFVASEGFKKFEKIALTTGAAALAWIGGHKLGLSFSNSLLIPIGVAAASGATTTAIAATSSLANSVMEKNKFIAPVAGSLVASAIGATLGGYAFGPEVALGMGAFGLTSPLIMKIPFPGIKKFAGFMGGLALFASAGKIVYDKTAGKAIEGVKQTVTETVNGVKQDLKNEAKSTVTNTVREFFHLGPSAPVDPTRNFVVPGGSTGGTSTGSPSSGQPSGTPKSLDELNRAIFGASTPSPTGTAVPAATPTATTPSSSAAATPAPSSTRPTMPALPSPVPHATPAAQPSATPAPGAVKTLDELNEAIFGKKTGSIETTSPETKSFASAFKPKEENKAYSKGLIKGEGIQKLVAQPVLNQVDTAEARASEPQLAARFT